MGMQTLAEQAWRQAIECGELGVWDLRPPLDTVHHSPQWKERLGFPNVREADSTDFWRCRVHPDDLDSMLEAIHTHTDGSSRSYEARFRLRSNGSGYRLLHSRGRVVERDARGLAVRMIGTMVDLTERPPSPRGGLPDGARNGIVAESLAHPFHIFLSGPRRRADAAGSGTSTDPAYEEERVVDLVRDLLDASVEQLQEIGVAAR
jgi:hypothetical protein